MTIKMMGNAKPAAAERQAEAFISGAVKLNAPDRQQHRTALSLRFDPGLLARLDAAARRRGVSRTAWIHTAVSKALCEEPDA